MNFALLDANRPEVAAGFVKGPFGRVHRKVARGHRRVVFVGEVFCAVDTRAEVITFPGVGHLPVIETPEALPAIASFLAAEVPASA